MDEIEQGDARRAHLLTLIHTLRDGLKTTRWQLAPSQTAIQPLIVGDNHEALALSAALQAQGILVPAIRPPTVPVGMARLRISLSAAHALEDVERLIKAILQAEKTVLTSTLMPS